MKQIVQNLKNGETLLEDVPVPKVQDGYVLIKTHRSLVSLGTEKMLVEFGKGSLISKARQQPDKVKQVLDKIKTEGLLPTLEAVFNKLDEPLPLGYCNAGEVIAVGKGVAEFVIGDRVASNGHHAEIVSVPKNLVAKIPDEVSYDNACFAVIGAIGLHGIRLAKPELGETIVVIGLGLIGLITAQLLVINGCIVIGFDFDQSKVDIATSMGVKSFNTANIDVVRVVEEITGGTGSDAVIITASTKSNDVISQAAKMSRKRGRIVLVGVVGLDIKRENFYKKELSFQVSCSYGPGRYDDNYEHKGQDYPLSYVRWTEKRNFEAVLYAIQQKRLDVESLISERVALQDYLSVYNNLRKSAIASVIVYPVTEQQEVKSSIPVKLPVSTATKGVIGIVGAGNFTKMTIMPALKKTGARLRYICSAGGLTAKSLAKKYGFEYASTDYTTLLADTQVDLILITTRHNQHADIVSESLKAGKSVFVEKPLAISKEGLLKVINAYQENPQSLDVGYNRRFSPFIQKAKQLIGNGSGINIIATMNAGFIQPEVWVHDLEVGGGRIIGEACHYIDLMIFLTGSLVSEVVTSGLGQHPRAESDNAIIMLKFENGSQGVINYFANGDKAYSKERIEIFSQGRTLIVDNFRKMQGYGFKGFSSYVTSIDKGHKTQFSELIQRRIDGMGSLIPFNEIVNSTQAVLAAIESLQSKKWVTIEKLI
jgi:predicted dehydrogenase/threonine dehydrogenase-like Zn-dependent dehydrogenase